MVEPVKETTSMPGCFDEVAADLGAAKDDVEYAWRQAVRWAATRQCLNG